MYKLKKSEMMNVSNTRRIKISSVTFKPMYTFPCLKKKLGTKFQSLAALAQNDRPPSDSRLKRGQAKFMKPWRLLRFLRFYSNSFCYHTVELFMSGPHCQWSPVLLHDALLRHCCIIISVRWSRF